MDYQRTQCSVNHHFEMQPDNTNFTFPLCLLGKSLQNFYIASSNMLINKINLDRSDDGHCIYWGNRSVSTDDLCVRCGVRQTGGKPMNMFYVIGAAVAAGLLVYLVVALLKAEDL